MQSIQSARIRKILPPAIAVLTILLCALSTAYSLRLILRAYHGALLWDEWDSIDFFDRLRQGTVTFHDFIRQHNEHRILFPRLVFALDLALTEARNTINLASILVCQALHVLLFHRLISLSVADRLLKWTLTVVRRADAVQHRAEGEFHLGLPDSIRRGIPVLHNRGFHAVRCAGAPVGARRALAAGRGRFLLRRRRRTGHVERRGGPALHRPRLCGSAPVQSPGRRDRALRARPAGLSYAATFTPNPGHTPLGFAAQHPLIFIQYVSTYLGCVFAPLGLKVAFGAGLLGVTGTAVALLALFTGRLERNRTNLTLVAILVFVGLTAALTAIGRSSFGLEQAASSRYATPERRLLGGGGHAGGRCG